ncbi:hypothetical protein BT96DRAFT_915713 [Gymnopus androsaceus JB14]|uniref:Uncharacterized protein n=1 Tax=Gymnopus androsaceus JB14 TaxID=1447944 RepID=A0A6A4I5Y9_9AGAR|nr:hypothetical protein BT96DRAFT_915713 [Gymnopus androsaceus JB14]
MVEHLQKHQPELGITARDIACVKIAGLCHDLGHGPFSHIWDNQFMPLAQPRGGWTHEHQSEIMLDVLVAENNVPLPPADVAFVKDLIAGEVKHTKVHSPPEKSFLFEIVANKRNSLDVDKWDYIARDLLATGDRGDWSALRLIQSARVIDGEICYNLRDVHTVFNLYQTRYRMYGIYNHKTRKALECMVVDALLAADPHMNLSRRVEDPKSYLHLTDDILLEIERSDDPRLKEAQSILRRIRVRELYRLTDTVHLPYGARLKIKSIFTAENIVKEAQNFVDAHPLAQELRNEHIFMDITPLHWGMKDKNPFDTIKFYRGKGNIQESFHLGPLDKTLIFPQVFAEVMVRAYTKDKKYTEAIRAAFNALVNRSLADLLP